MNELRVSKPPTTLRLLNLTIKVCIFILGFASVFSVMWLAITLLADNGASITVHGTTDNVTVIQDSPTGGSAERDLTTSSTLITPAPDELKWPDLPDIWFTDVNAEVGVTDRWARLVTIAVGFAHVAVLWVVLLSLRGITQATLVGNVFTPENARRLSWLGRSVLVLPILGAASEWAITKALENADNGINRFQAEFGIADRLEFFIAGLFLISLARVFKWGVELSEFEAATI